MSNHTLRVLIRKLSAELEEARVVVAVAEELMTAINDMAEKALSVDWQSADDVLVIMTTIAELTSALPDDPPDE